MIRYLKNFCPKYNSVHFPGHFLAFSASFLPSEIGIFCLQYSSYFSNNQVIFIRWQISSIPQFADLRTADVRSAYLLKHPHIPIKKVIKCVITPFAGPIFYNQRGESRWWFVHFIFDASRAERTFIPLIIADSSISPFFPNIWTIHLQFLFLHRSILSVPIGFCDYEPRPSTIDSWQSNLDTVTEEER